MLERREEEGQMWSTGATKYKKGRRKWEWKYPCPTLLALFTGRRGPFHPAVIWGPSITTGWLASSTPAAWRQGPRRNGPKVVAYVTHRGGRRSSQGEMNKNTKGKEKEKEKELKEKDESGARQDSINQATIENEKHSLSQKHHITARERECVCERGWARLISPHWTLSPCRNFCTPEATAAPFKCRKG